MRTTLTCPLHTQHQPTLHIYTSVFALFWFCFCFLLFKVCVSLGSRSPSKRPNMSRTTDPVGHWEDLETWLSVATDSLLPKAAETLKHQTQDQLDNNITSLMRQDPSQSYKHKELAKITSSLSHTLMATLKLSDRHAAHLQQELTHAQRRVEQLELEAQERREGPDEVEQGAEEEITRLRETLVATTQEMEQVKTANNKPVKHQELFQACDTIVTEHDMIIYWKKVRGHSRQPGQDKYLNDQTDALAKAGALHGESWTFPALPPTPSVAPITRRHHATGAQTPTSSHIELSPQFTANDLLTLQASNPVLQTIATHISYPLTHTISTSDLSNLSDLRQLHSVKHMLHLKDGVLTYVPEPLTTPKLVVPQGQRGMMLTHAHNAPCAGHHGARATYEMLKQVAYWPGMRQDMAEYVNGCLMCCQFQPANPNHRAPLQRKGMTFPWSDLQIDWVGPLPRSTRGNKYFLAVVCEFTK
uniref:Gypsy retrotransposon integrase-like protein 1 n=1 Tax=Cyprinus carpio carpio TaxID=630221 RepID=A0A9J7YLF7_CYPCA